MKTAKFFIVGYTTRPSQLSRMLTPSFEAPASYKDKDKIADYIANKRAEFFANASATPYVGELASVTILNDQGGHARFEGNLEVSIARYLTEACADFVDEDGNFTNGNPVRLVGFEIRRFVKMMGLGAAMNADADFPFQLPHAMWYGAEHRDAYEIVLPTECKGLSLEQVLHALNILSPERTADYQPCVDDAEDVQVVAKILRRFNMFPTANAMLDGFLYPASSKLKAKKK